MKRLALAIALLALGAVAATLFGATSAGAGPTPTVQNVREQNLDANGNIKVHEQGTAKVQEQNVDANQNVKVHEQGTANVNVTNSSLSVAAAPVTGGGGSSLGSCNGPDNLGFQFTASALSIHMDPGVSYLVFLDGANQAASFAGPAVSGNASVVIGLTRPVRFDSIDCLGDGNPSTNFAASWVGNTP
jgi:hypothetical protein